ncbi:variable large family protein [Borreliella burgdorferi]|uniref:variable large family protein n=1 Tax=Borreliella burgdorferi TaxID=139 RepID=UPI0001981EA1|nr:variable large family protein [Borreliella burgdorferi]EEG99398.1 outer surface protein VlsE [Borreliella burgdorferi 94a]
MGYGFVDVFNAIGGLVSDVFYKADPKKSDVKNYFESIAKILQDTQAKLDALSKEQGGGDRGTQVVDTSKKVSGWIKEMKKAVDDTAKAGDGGSESIANVAVGGNAGGGGGDGAKADAGSVTGIAKGMKAIVDAAKKAGVELKADDVAGAGNNDAGRLFANGNNARAADAGNEAEEAAEKAGEAVSAVSGDQILKAIVDAAGSTGGKGAGTAKDAVEAAIGGDGAGAAFGAGEAFAANNDAEGAAEKAGEAVSAVSGDQILKAIVDAAGSTEGKRANDAKDAVEAAIGDNDAGEGAAFGNGDMQKKNQIAAAIVLRGLAKGGKFANANDAGNANGAKVVAAVKTSGWIKEMKKAVDDTAKAGDGGSDLIANVAAGGGNDNAGKKADKDSVTGIAKGMKAIVDAAKKAGVELKPADADAGGGAGDGAAGRLFASGNNAGAADAAQGAAAKAGEAVSAVSGDQILKAIVDAAGTTEGKGAGDATNAVEAAIGDDNAAAAFAANMKKNQIAAAIVLRGLAKGGKFANANAGDANGKVVAAVKTSGWIKEMKKAVEDTAKAGTGSSNESIANVAAGGGAAAGNGDGANKDSVTGIAKGMKAIVEAAKKAGVEFKPDDVAGGADDGAAGRLFANGAAGDDAQAQGAAEKAGEAVSAVSGDQILKAIIDAAGSTEGKGAAQAKDAVEAAIGGDNDAAAFAANMKKNQIAAAIVLRGLAKGGKFANTNAGDANGKVVAAVKTSGWIKEMKKAVDDTAKAGDGGSESIANVAVGGANGNGAKADAGSVTGIAKGMKAIVDAAKKAGVEFKPDDVAGGGAGNNDAGKLFANAAGANADEAEAQGAAEKAGEAVSAVSGDQILKAIIDAAGSTEGKGAAQAKDAVEAAIGGDNDAAAFAANMKKNQIAAAIVLRGLAKGGKFANTNAGDANTKVKAAVKTSGWIKEMKKAVDDTAKAGDGGNESIANVAVGGANGNGAKADAGSVTGIAKGMKAIVDAAKKAGVELKADDVADAGNNDAGKLFANAAGANADEAEAQGAAEKAGEAVSAVSGDQILKAIVDAAGSTEGKGAAQAKDAVEAAIGDNAAGVGVAFGNGNMKKKNQIAAAIVLRGLAKDGKFANANDAANGKVVAAVKTSKWIKEMNKAVEDTAKAGDGSSDSIANVAGSGGGNDAGRLFANGAAGTAAEAQGAAEKAGEAVSAVSGDQILKAIVDAAGSTEGKGAGDATNAVEAAIGGNAAGVAFAAGKLFASGAAGAGNEAEEAAEKAGEAVSAVSGDQILKAIVDAAGTTEGKGAGTATNAVEAAIGAGAGAGAAFGAGMQKKNQIAAAIVLRGLAKDGKFANANNDANTKVKAAVKTSEWIKEMQKAVEDTAKAGTGSSDLIANVAAGGAGAGAGNGANKGSVTGIAKGMKAIVDAAKKAGVELKADDVAGDANGAGRLFANGDNANAGAGNDADAQGAAEKAGATEGKRAGTATNAVEAAIGGGGNAAAFGGNMKKKNQIAAAIVLRGLAKGGKFANANNDGDGANTKVKAAVKSAVDG